MTVRRATAKARFLALAIAAAIAVPANLPTWTPDEGGRASSPAAHRDGGAAGRPVLIGASQRASWHTGCIVYGDPSDEPDEGSDDWVPSADRAMPAQVVTAVPVADAPGLASAASARLPLAVGTPCRLRC